MVKRTKHTMRDVARLAGVSTSTVSAVVNESVVVSPKRKERVLAAMSALNYHPDVIARSLKTGRSNAVGVVVPDITNAFYPEVIRSVELAAQDAGYSVLLCDSNEDRAQEERHLSALFSRRVDGLIIACCADSRANELIARSHIPVMFIDRLPPSTHINSVCTDNVAAGQLATEHLIGLGHRRIGLLAGHLGLSPHRDRLEGFRKAMQQAHLPILDEYLITGGVQVEDGIKAGHSLLDLSNRPTGIVASNSKLLLGVLQAMDDRNVAIPKDMSVLGFDDSLWNMHFSPKLTAVAQATGEIGRRSFELLHELVKDPIQEDAAPINVLVPAEIRIRDSTARIGGSDG